MMTSSLEKTSFTRTEKTEQIYHLRANKSIESLHGIASDKKKISSNGQLLCALTPISCKASNNFTTLLKSSSKIPCRLGLQSSATSWKHPNKLLPFRRSTSLRLRNSKSNCANRVKMAENGIALAGANYTDGSETGNGQVVSSTSRRKLKSLTRPATRNEQPLKRSLSLRKNFKISSSSLNKTESLKQQQIQKCLENQEKEENPIKNIAKSIEIIGDSTSSGDELNKSLSLETIVLDNYEDIPIMSLNKRGSPITAAAASTAAVAVAAADIQIRPFSLEKEIATTTLPATGNGKIIKVPNNNNNTATTTTTCHSQQGVNVLSSPNLKLTPKTPPVTPDSPTTYLNDDLDSSYSFATTTSGRSTMSCEHPYVARNGTTFSGRKMKYVVHCSSHAGQVGSNYLTPTQRAQQQIRRLKELLCTTRQDLEQRDTEILRLTREVVELRLFKASLSSPDERSASSDAVTVREADLKTSQDVSPIVDMVDDAQKSSSPRHHAHIHHRHAASLQQQHLQHGSSHHVMHVSSEMQSSFADSGHFEDLTSSSVHSKDSSFTPPHTHDQACGSDEATGVDDCISLEQYELQRQELIRLYEQRIEDLIRNQDANTSEIKRTNNDRIEALLQKLAECNTRYADIVPDYEHAKERIRELEKQLEDLQRKLVEHEEKQKQMYLHMYQKGQEAERIARADQVLELAHRAPQNKVSINELLHQLQSTQDELENIRTIYRRLLEAQKNRTHVDPEVTLQFLKSAVYYFLTDKENSQGHLQAIESILDFSEAEKQNINKARTGK
ncbi:uncharacterized protein LOC119635550 isoform X2 [Glossina fuscipes]|uniref:Uncharacterized protein LOC119635550 isoform X2 n=1 Tax=Glossina fuscipes TaxID=7396 RepID=A0A9C5Z1B6_9MUSC|nr:uncharacterized protein LOC119635550 isoform X2 [Glossina fuscipes]